MFLQLSSTSDLELVIYGNSRQWSLHFTQLHNYAFMWIPLLKGTLFLRVKGLTPQMEAPSKSTLFYGGHLFCVPPA